MTSKSPTGVCDSRVTMRVPASRSAASSCFGGRNARSQTMSAWSLNSRYIVWKPRFDIATK